MVRIVWPKTVRLQVSRGAVDIASMMELAMSRIGDEPDWQTVLAAYQTAEPAPVSHEDSQPGWIPRVGAVEDVPAETLSRVHGKLIALGLLEFELAGRTSGVRYRVSRRGHALLRSATDSDSEGTCDDDLAMEESEAESYAS